MKSRQLSGFTLIELLTVIAIIAILAAFTATALPRVLERARVADTENTLNQMRTALTGYFTQYKTYPLGYGFIKRNPPGETNTIPYMQAIGHHGEEKMYDYFSDGLGLDTDGNGNIGLLEESPGEPPNLKKRPFIYAPVNKETFERFRRAVGENWDGATWPAAANSLNLLAPRYDAFVLISVGPYQNTAGIVEAPNESAFIASLPDQNFRYQAAALRTYYLATRDINKNGLLDFDFRARTRQGEAKPESYSNPDLRLLPDGTNGPGPIIFHQD